MNKSGPFVQRLDNTTHQINRYPVNKCHQNKPRYPLYSDYPVDSVIQLSNNSGHKRNTRSTARDSRCKDMEIRIQTLKYIQLRSPF